MSRHSEYRAARRAVGGCIECQAPAVEGEGRCADHKERARQRRARYEQRKRDESGRTWDAYLDRCERRRAEECARLVGWAMATGHVPSRVEAGRVLGAHPLSTRVGEIRCAAFGIRTLGFGEVPRNQRIPYPVPSEFLDESREQVSA